MSLGIGVSEVELGLRHGHNQGIGLLSGSFTDANRSMPESLPFRALPGVVGEERHGRH